MQQVVVLERKRQPLPDVLAKPGIHRRRIATAEHQIHAALRQMLQHRVVLRDLDRVVRRHQRHRCAEDDPLRQRGDVRQQGGWRGRDEGRVVMLADREYVQAHLVRLTRDTDDRLDPLCLARGAAGDRIPGDVADREDSELHLYVLTKWNYMTKHLT